MRVTLRAKLMAITGTTALAFIILIIATAVLTRRVTAELSRIQQRFLPKIELGPRIEGQLDALARGFQDAVSARDNDALKATDRLKGGILDLLTAGEGAIEPASADALRTALDDYYATAFDVSKRLIAGETGEPIVDSIAHMQAKQRQVLERAKAATAFDRDELSRAFLAASHAVLSGQQTSLAVSALCLLLVVALNIWVGRSLLASVDQLSSGLERFGTGRFDEHITPASSDELAEVARHANQMADNLKALAAERDRQTWLKTGQAGLVQDVRGELTPTEAADRACAYLSRYLEAPAAALYYRAGPGELALLGSFAASAAPRFRIGEGLVGQAALQSELRIVREVPRDYLTLRSGLGQGPAAVIVLVPLLHGGQVQGVLELALLKPWSDTVGDLLLSVRESLAIAIEVSLTRVHLEQQRRTLEERNRELESTRRHLERQTEELATVSSYKTQFLTNMSHELRTPLNSMLLLSGLLAENADGNLSPKQVEFGQTIHAAGKDLLALINQVLDLAKVEAGKMQVNLGPVPLRGVADRAQRVFEPLAREKNLAFEVTLSSSAPATLWSDGKRIDQILNNLIGNAIKFTERGTVRFSIVPGSDGGATLYVTDTGPGIRAADRERIFAPFEQVEGGVDRRHGGTGLGLTIARELAELLGGSLELLQSAPGTGTTFACHLPPRAPAPEGVASGPAAPSPAPPTRELADVTVLVVDDDERTTFALSAMLQSKGAEVLLATTGQAALDLLEARPDVDAVLMDVMMPGMDGYEATRRIRAGERFRALPIIALTAAAAPGDAERCFAAGASGYLPKPVTVERLLPFLQALLAKRV
jgi:signal transduction histidine kinase/ActR/RegA family two-component response regulator